MSLKAIAFRGMKWSTASLVGRRLLSMLSNVILARLLLPVDFGLIAMTGFVIGFFEIFRDLGTGTAVVQRKELTQELLSSVFWLNVAVGIFVTAIIALGAPLIAEFYREPKLMPVLQAMSAGFLFASLNIVHTGLLNRQMQFERLAIREVIAAVAAAIFGITLAYMGYGVWSLVSQVLAGAAIGTVLLWWASDWRPSLVFRWSELRPVLGYSINLVGSGIAVHLSRSADSLLIGRYLGARDLGIYDLAYRLMLYPIQAVSPIVSRVMFPLYTKMQDDEEKFRSVFLRVAQSIAIVTFPMLLGLFAVADQLVLVVFGPAWSEASALLMILAPVGAIQSVTTTGASILAARGRSDLLFKLSLASAVVLVAAFAVGLQWGVVGVATSYAVAYVALQYPTFRIACREIGLPMREFFKTLARPAACSLVMVGAVKASQALLPSDLRSITAVCASIGVGALSYAALTWWWNRAAVMEVLDVVRAR